MERPESVTWEYEGPVDFFKQLAKTRDIPRLAGTKASGGSSNDGKASVETKAVNRATDVHVQPMWNHSSELNTSVGSSPQSVGFSSSSAGPKMLAAPPLPGGAPPVSVQTPPPLPPGVPTGISRAAPPLPPGVPPVNARSGPPLPPGPPPAAKPTGTSSFLPPLPPGPPPGVRAPAESKLPYRKAAPLPESVKQAPPPPVSVTAFKNPAPSVPPPRSFGNNPVVTFAADTGGVQAQKARPKGRPRGMSLSSSNRRTVESYDKAGQVGGGTYGDVFKARDRETGEIVALKKVRLEDEKEGFPVTALREIKFLSQVDHPNVVKLKEVVSSKPSDATRGKGSVYMVFEYAECDLVGLMKTAKLNETHIMCMMKQLLQALHFAHANNVLHRDIKPSNVLVNGEGIVKLADWGLCRQALPGAKYTNRVVTLWYRAPELLLGEQQYTSAVDMWAMGCLMAELLLGKAILPGKDELDQLKKIFDLCGTLGPGNWPKGWDNLSLAKDLQVMKAEPQESQVNLRFASLRPHARDLVLKMLELDPSKRITASQALDHDYFWSPEVAPCDPSMIPVPKGDGLHEYQLKEAEAARMQERKQHQQAHDGHHHHDKKWKRVSPVKQQ